MLLLLHFDLPVCFSLLLGSSTLGPTLASGSVPALLSSSQLLSKTLLEGFDLLGHLFAKELGLGLSSSLHSIGNFFLIPGLLLLFVLRLRSRSSTLHVFLHLLLGLGNSSSNAPLQSSLGRSYLGFLLLCLFVSRLRLVPGRLLGKVFGLPLN